ncbi:MAG: aminoacetone oxidase family FAD-binding enzyme, partial [Clostridia bacterium]|nr:aminoacetone oxidase family FAD-binding enzyme [Clostridia bacterium]
LEDGITLDAYAVVVATGGCSYPQTGSDGSGYQLAKQAGHTVTALRPSLVPLESADTYCKEMQGLAPKNCTLTVEDTQKRKVIFSEFGEMLFTHFGISGPLVLSASAHMREMTPLRYVAYVDWKPALTAEQLDARLVREFETFKNNDFSNALGKLLPQKAVPVFVRLSGVEGTRKCHSITKEERRRFGELLKRFPVHISGTRPIAEAIITAGGVDVKEINAATMGSKLVDGLYFAGEILDVDAYTGGFNLQIAFATGKAAGEHV